MVKVPQFVATRPNVVASRPIEALFRGTLFRLKNDESRKVWSAQMVNGEIIGWPLLEDGSILMSNGLFDPKAEALVLDPSDLGITCIVIADPDEVELSE